MDSELISVIIPVYNGEKYIKKCLESVINQTYNNIEIIVVDDGSTDKTSEIIKKIANKDKRIVHIKSMNHGVSTARNLGIKKAKGEYLTFVDSDDTIQSNYVAYLYEIIKNNDCEIALTRYPNKIIENHEYAIDNKNDDAIVLNGILAAKEMLSYKIVISSWNKMYKRKMITDNKIFFNKELSYGEGFDFVIRAFLVSKNIALSNKKIYNYRVDNPNSVMTHYKEKLVIGSLDSQQCILKNINNLNDIYDKSLLIKTWKYSNWHTYCDCLNTIIGCNAKKSNINLYKKIKKYCRKNALCGIKLNVSYKDKIKMFMFFVSPVLTSKFINAVRVRKFKKEL